MFIIKFLFLILTTVIPLLITVAFFTLYERKLIASIQRRRGPNVIGFWGFLQGIADGLKLILKEVIIPSKSNSILFLIAPVLTMTLSFSLWALIPFNFTDSLCEINPSVLIIFALSSLNTYSLILAGWSSNSKYALLAALRAIAQMISYEISLSLSILPILMFSSSLNLIDIVISQQATFYLIPFFPLSLFFFISMLAETNRSPFDLPEAEAELVAGYNVEYSSIAFALFFLGEYCSIIFMSSLWVIFFFGGWLPLFYGYFNFLPGLLMSIKINLVCFMFVFVRACLPRYRYDHLMDIGWKIFLPVSLGYVLFTAGFIFFFLAGLDSNEIIFNTSNFNLSFGYNNFIFLRF